MPELTSRALAEFSVKPIADQMRVLAEQKRPNSGASQYKVHYYQSTRAAIGNYFKKGNDPAQIANAIVRVQTSGMADHKKEHNERAMHAFLNTGSLISRVLTPKTSSSVTHARHGTTIRLFPDLTATENDSDKFILFNFTIAPTDPELARRTLELSYWLHSLAGLSVKPSSFEYVDLTSNTVHTNNKKPRASIIKNADANLKAIKQLWPII